VYISTGSGCVVEEVYKLVSVAENTPGPNTAGGIGATSPVPDPKSCVYIIFVRTTHGGIMAATVIRKGVG
jgi:hypothetical protein